MNDRETMGAEAKVPRSKSGEHGQAMVEFALVFPIQLFLILAILEISLIQVGRLMVGYAAYCASHAEMLGQNPNEAAALALIPLCDEDPGTYYDEPEEGAESGYLFESSSTAFPGWGEIPKWANARSRVQVYRLVNWDSNVLNRCNIIQDEGEEMHTNRVHQHNIGVEVRFLYRLRVPISILSFLWGAEELDEFDQWHDSVVVMWDGEPYIVLRERWLMPNKGRIIQSTLPLKDITGEDFIDDPVKEMPDDPLEDE